MIKKLDFSISRENLMIKTVKLGFENYTNTLDIPKVVDKIYLD